VDAGVIAAIIGALSAVAVAVVTAILGLRTYPRQKAVDRKDELRKERGKAYVAYLAAYSDVERWRGVPQKEKEFGDALVAYSRSYSALFNVAEDGVLTPTTNFHRFTFVEPYNLPPPEWAAEWKRRYAEMLLAMRSDAFVETTDIDVNELAERLPWYFEWDTKQKAQQAPAAPA
jgi:hypothetical protein